MIVPNEEENSEITLNFQDRTRKSKTQHYKQKTSPSTGRFP